jgi:hypothetical protein
LGALHELYDRFRGSVEFFIVYIKEAHPEDGWVMIPNREEGIAVMDAKSDEERSGAAHTCLVKSSIRIPMLIDGLDNRVASAYGGWPDRLYLIGRDGRVAFQGDPGPFGFLPENLAAAIDAELLATGS